MNQSPFLTSSRRRMRREAARRRRRRRRVVLVILLLLTVAAVALVGLGAGGSTHGNGVRYRGEQSTRPPAPALSPMGLRLGRPAVALSGPSPSEQVTPHFDREPRAGMLFDLDDGHVFWSRNAHRRLRIASLTKMMTALVVVQSSAASERVLVTREAVAAAGSKVGVLPLGKHVRLESMLYGLLLPSGNDAATALAQHVSGRVDRFVDLMNQQAASMGLGCTRYSSPSGYLDAGNYSCVADLAELAIADMRNPRISRVVGTYRAVLPFPIKGGHLYLFNNNPLMRYGYPGVTGLKTGYTEAAGECLLATAERHGVRLGVVLLHSPAPAVQAQQLLDRGFSQIFHQRPVEEPAIPPGA